MWHVCAYYYYIILQVCFVSFPYQTKRHRHNDLGTLVEIHFVQIPLDRSIVVVSNLCRLPKLRYYCGSFVGRLCFGPPQALRSKVDVANTVDAFHDRLSIDGCDSSCSK